MSVVELPSQTSDGIQKITRATEVLGGLKPLLSNAESKRGDLTVERYKIGGRVITPPVYFENQHLVAIQWTGQVKESRPNARTSGANATSIFPVGLALREQAMSSVEFTNLVLDRSFLRRIAGEAGLDDRFELVPQWAIRDQQIESIAHAAESEIKSDSPAGNLFMESLATALAAHVLARYTLRPAVGSECRGGMSPYQLRRTRDLIEANLGEGLGLAELAANVGMSTYHFCRMFKQATSLTPHQFVIKKRIQQSQQWLREHRQTTAEIAGRLGFSDQSHFARVFRTTVGITPKQYSSQH